MESSVVAGICSDEPARRGCGSARRHGLRLVPDLRLARMPAVWAVSGPSGDGPGRLTAVTPGHTGSLVRGPFGGSAQVGVPLPTELRHLRL